MATITLYKDKINGVGSLLDDIIKSSNNLNAQLGTLKNTLQGVDSSTCNLQDTVDSISSSSKSEKDKVEDLKRLNSRLTEFIEMTTRRDASAKSEIERAKKDFYTKYSYLKPECEKSRMEKIVDAMKKACEWCKEHWKLLVTIVIVAVSIVLLCTGVGAILAGACWGAILGAVIGGVSGGINSAVHGGSFLEGFENGAFNGAISGAIGGAISGGLTSALGPATTLARSIGQGAAIGSLSSGTSNMAVTTINYLIDHGNLNGALDDILVAGFSGALSGGILGGIMGGVQFKISTAKPTVQGEEYLGDQMSYKDAARYNKYWKDKGIGSDKTWNEFQQHNPNSTIDDYMELVKEQSPWPKGYDPEQNITTLKEGDTFNMVLDRSQPLDKPGGFGLLDDVPNSNFARNNMAIKNNWKADCGKVVTYQVKSGVTLDVRTGPIGPQIDLGVDKYLPGDISLTQLDLFKGLSGIDRMDYIEPLLDTLKFLD